MIRVLNITVYPAKESEKILSKTYYDLQFTTEDGIQRWIEGLTRHYNNLFGFETSVYVSRRTKPDKNIDMMAVLINTAKIMGFDIEDVISKKRTRELVDVRKTACMILIDADYAVMDIEKQLPFKNRVIYSYRSQMLGRFQTEPGYFEKYKSIREKVMDMTIKKTGSEDGSGLKKPKINDKQRTENTSSASDAASNENKEA